jgi:hypothetical protein
MIHDTPEDLYNVMTDNIHIDQPSDFTAATSGNDNASIDMHHHFIEMHPLINGN